MRSILSIVFVLSFSTAASARCYMDCIDGQLFCCFDSQTCVDQYQTCTPKNPDQVADLSFVNSLTASPNNLCQSK